LHVGFLDYGGHRLLGHPAGLQEAREIAALAQFVDSDAIRPGIPI
jgi:hypothetical protein